MFGRSTPPASWLTTCSSLGAKSFLEEKEKISQLSRGKEIHLNLTVFPSNERRLAFSPTVPNNAKCHYTKSLLTVLSCLRQPHHLPITKAKGRRLCLSLFDHEFGYWILDRGLDTNSYFKYATPEQPSVYFLFFLLCCNSPPFVAMRTM